MPATLPRMSRADAYGMNLNRTLESLAVAAIVAITATGCSSAADRPLVTPATVSIPSPTVTQPANAVPTPSTKPAPAGAATQKAAKAALTQAAAAASAAAEAVARDEAAATSNPEGDPAS